MHRCLRPFVIYFTRLFYIDTMLAFTWGCVATKKLVCYRTSTLSVCIVCYSSSYALPLRSLTVVAVTLLAFHLRFVFSLSFLFRLSWQRICYYNVSTAPFIRIHAVYIVCPLDSPIGLLYRVSDYLAIFQLHVHTCLLDTAVCLFPKVRKRID